MTRNSKAQRARFQIPDTAPKDLRRARDLHDHRARSNGASSSTPMIAAGKTPRRAPLISSILAPLLAWFADNARDLPWRRTRDPYAIWISEIMLQQTQVKTVIPYFERWLRQLPTIESLARAKPGRILKLWEGLGYYTRVRNLQQAAQQIVAEHDGRFPNDLAAILALPGIGRYTAGAIASIAFNQPQPILDGNVTRVLTRIFGIDGNPRQKSTNSQLWSLAEALVHEAARLRVDGERTCSHLNQALMELGALVCTPRQPHCHLCPVQTFCTARHEGWIDQLPNLGERPPPTQRRFVAFVVERNGRVLIAQRPAGVVNAHLWEFPNVEAADDSSDITNLATRFFGAKPSAVEPLGRIKHSITRYRITLEAYRCEFGAGLPHPRGTVKWQTFAQVKKLPFTSAHGRILRQSATARRLGQSGR